MQTKRIEDQSRGGKKGTQRAGRREQTVKRGKKGNKKALVSMGVGYKQQQAKRRREPVIGRKGVPMQEVWMRKKIKRGNPGSAISVSGPEKTAEKKKRGIKETNNNKRRKDIANRGTWWGEMKEA